MRSFPTLEPVVANRRTFVVERALGRDGDIFVGVGDCVTPETIIGQSADLEKPATVYVANELGVEPENLRKYLTISAGTEIKKDEVIARVRRGLRTTSVVSPVDGTLVMVDEKEGKVTISTAVGPENLRSLVHGAVEQIFPSRGVLIKSFGARIYGIVGFGREVAGELAVGNNRNDTELDADQVTSDWSGKVVVAGMTLGVPAMHRLAEAGVAGVIVGSISEASIRRFVASLGDASGSLAAPQFWKLTRGGERLFSRPEHLPPFSLVVTEGFGHQPMAASIFDALARFEGETVAMRPRTIVGERLERPAIYVTTPEQNPSDKLSDELTPGRIVRVNDPSQVGQVGVAAGEPYAQIGPNGMVTQSVKVTMQSGEERAVPLDNTEVIS